MLPPDTKGRGDMHSCIHPSVRRVRYSAAWVPINPVCLVQPFLVELVYGRSHVLFTITSFVVFFRTFFSKLRRCTRNVNFECKSSYPPHVGYRLFIIFFNGSQPCHLIRRYGTCLAFKLVTPCRTTNTCAEHRWRRKITIKDGFQIYHWKMKTHPIATILHTVT